MGIGTSVMELCGGGESLGSIPSTARAIYSQGAEWGLMDRKLLRGNSEDKEESG